MHMTARMHGVDSIKTVPWKHAMQSAVYRSDQQIHGTCRQAADHSNRAMEAQAIVAAIQQQYKKRCNEAKKINGQV